MQHVWQTHLGGEAAFDPQYHENARTEVASFLDAPPGLVLDIGCGGGATGKLIKEKHPGTRVVGIEINHRAAEHARQFLDDVICARLEDVRIEDHIGDAAIGTVLLLDVLEHLEDPWRALVRIREWLKPRTRVLASVPNIRNLANLDSLAAGRWEYAQNGVLDITHLRFFTRASLRELFEQTGYTVRHMEPLTQPAALDRLVVARRPGKLFTRNIAIAYRDRDDLEDLYALQYVVDARIAERS
jgi:2-polyprenyl-3-methyl-5-hydroxy-6-metoxy-1,4-benzoquinol methylase